MQSDVVNYQRTWTTEEEIDFIKSLRPEIRSGYIKALQFRQFWGKVDKDKILEMFSK